MDSLNLARKLRPKTFSQIVGQDLAVNIIKNTLFKNFFFPLYIFSGERGCGKTTTARIFGAAINCEKLSIFQKNSKIEIPCLECKSCNFFLKNSHPDFIEIDAASYTGVENIRNIIDTSSFLPIFGNKKIYLIDEAHMLSKSAFNAFLKLLEEPPKFVVFILVTTEINKIIDTVRSRAFQLFFDLFEDDSIFNYLQNVCLKENILFDPEALKVIANEANGSLRDALNLLEQVRFYSFKVTIEATNNVFGHLSENFILDIFEDILFLENLDFSIFLEKIKLVKNNSIEYLWKKLIEFFYYSILIKNQINFDKKLIFSNKILEKIYDLDFKILIKLFDLFVLEENILLKISDKKIFFEIFILKILKFKNFKIENIDKNKNLISDDFDFNKNNIKDDFLEEKLKRKNEDFKDENKNSNFSEKEDLQKLWELFLNQNKEKFDKIVLSVLINSKIKEYDKEKNKIIVSCFKKFSIFNDFIQEKNLFLKKEFFLFSKKNIEIIIIFDEENKKQEEVLGNLEKNINSANKIFYKENSNNKFNNDKLDISDKDNWPISNFLIESFEGDIVEIKEKPSEK